MSSERYGAGATHSSSLTGQVQAVFAQTGRYREGAERYDGNEGVTDAERESLAAFHEPLTEDDFPCTI
ncbi:MAG: hypothetical protein SVW02_01165 [Candidatus Nanohaloarchaea archaeon]|nr:hypothetical protein [Candidatus Nanohaloarchaea archaeon]